MNLHTDVRYTVIERVRISLAKPSLETFKAIFSNRYVTITNDCLCKLLGKENVQPKVSKGVGGRVITKCQDVIDVPVSEPVSEPVPVSEPEPAPVLDAVVDKLPIKTTLQQGLEEWVDKADSSDDKKERKKASEIILSGICQKVPRIDLSECKLTSLPQALRNITATSFILMLGPYTLDNDSLSLIIELESLSNIHVTDSDEQIVGGVDQIGRYKKLLLTQLDSWSDSERDKGNVLAVSAIKRLRSSIAICLRKKTEIYIDLMGINLQHIPSFLAKIPGVTEIDFSGNPQLKKIPDFVFEMKCLKNIYFGGCGLTEIPDEISKLDGLENIIVSDNYIEKIPESVTKLKKLKKLYINNNKIDRLPENMGALGSLTILNCENNDLISQKKSELLPVNVKLFAGGSDVTNKELLLRLKLRRRGFLNLRSHTVKSNNGSITVMGSKIPAWGTIQELLKNEFNTIIFLVKAEEWMDIPDESKSIDLDESNSVDISNNASLMKFRHGNFDPVEINFTPVKDFEIPRSDQFILLHNAISKASIENKNVLISCSYGGGRTGAMLGCSKVLEKFKSLDDSEKSGLLYVPKTDKVSMFGGNFTHLTNNEKTTPIVAEVITELRESEKDLADGAVSIETPEQITALECWELMLRINYKVNNNPGITDDEIVELIKGGGFSSEFIEEFASCQESNIENLSAIYTLAKQIRLLKI